LARWQAEWVVAQLGQRGVAVELVPITTAGDRRQETISAIGGQGVFTKEIQRALLDGRIDLAVHSLKDLPTGPTPGLALAAVPERGPVGDTLLVNSKEPGPWPLSLLPHGTSVGTGSLRRRAQLLHVRPDLQMKDIRGNVETRLRKLEQGHFDALVLAEAGLRRLGLPLTTTRLSFQVLPLEIMLPAVGQGALALETRGDDRATGELVAALDHPPTHAAVRAERAMLAALQGGCLAPIAALGFIEAEQLTLTGRVLSHDGLELLEARQTIKIVLSLLRTGAGDEGCGAAEQLGRQVAEALLARGAGKLIAASRTK
jgi:hydroxymethylbilane synthase